MGEQTLTAEDQLKNVAQSMLRSAQVRRMYNGKGRSATYVGNADVLAHTGQQLAEMVLAYLRGELTDRVVDDELPF